MKHSNLILVLIVVAVVVVISSLDNPSYLQPQTRSRVSRVQNDLRSLALAIEAYHEDRQCYPAWRLTDTSPSMPVLWPLPASVGSLTTPVGYLGRLPDDPFTFENKPFHGYGYWSGDGQTGWIVYSLGPDLTYDIVPAEDYVPGSKTPSPALVGKTYDPTNGLKSRGDIYKYKN